MNDIRVFHAAIKENDVSAAMAYIDYNMPWKSIDDFVSIIRILNTIGSRTANQEVIVHYFIQYSGLEQNTQNQQRLQRNITRFRGLQNYKDHLLRNTEYIPTAPRTSPLRRALPNDLRDFLFREIDNLNNWRDPFASEDASFNSLSTLLEQIHCD